MSSTWGRRSQNFDRSQTKNPALATGPPGPLLRRLFSPIELNGLRMPNRLMMSSMHLNLEGLPDQYARMARFYELRAKAQVGLIVTAGCSPNEAGKASADSFSLEFDDLIPQHRTITDAVHEAGGRIALQILHFGREAFHGRIVSSSALRLRSNPFTPRPLSEGEIERTIEDFALCAARAAEAAYDGIELIFSQGFLIHQFLAPVTNRRTDAWGGSFENRARFAVAVARAVRERVGGAFPIVFRIPCMDLLDDGLTPHEALHLIDALLPFQIDLLNVSIGWHESSLPTIAMLAPRAAFVSAATHIRQLYPQLKIAASNRINDPRLAEQLLADGSADVIAMARPFLADPNLAEKARRNAFDEINTCIACNQSCLDYVFTGKAVGCSVNPDCCTPTEGQYPPIRQHGRIAVAGGGIAGLGTACFLARRGARVTLFESTTSLGGQLQLAVRVPDKAEFAETVRYYVQAAHQAGVELRLGQPFDEAAAASASWDFVVVAVGSEPVVPCLPGIDLPHVVSYVDVLRDNCPVAFPVVIIGAGGVACDVAKYIIERAGQYWRTASAYLAPVSERFELGPYLETAGPVARGVTLLQRSSRKVAYKIGRTTRWILVQELERAGVRMRNRIRIQQITPTGVEILDAATGQEETVPADTVIIAAGQHPRQGPLELLRSRGIPHAVIGAANAEGAASITTSLRSAYDLAMELT